MRDVAEFYPRKQGRPYSPARKDLESGLTLSESDSFSLRSEYVILKESIEKLMNELIQKQQALLVEATQIKLHLASLSEADVSEDDVDE